MQIHRDSNTSDTNNDGKISHISETQQLEILIMVKIKHVSEISDYMPLH